MRFSTDEIKDRIASVPEWFHQIEVAPGIVTPGRDPSPLKLKRLLIPEDLTGKRVLDIGTNDGFFSFECERRGAAEVVAIEEAPTPGFSVAHELLGSRVIFHAMSLYDLDPEQMGQFDLVLFLGVLYHLRDPLLALERIHALCRGQLVLETQVCDTYFLDIYGKPRDLARDDEELHTVPLAQFYPAGELNGDITNWWSPNLPALHGMLRSTGFVPEETISNGARACVACTRVSEPILQSWVRSDAPPEPDNGLDQAMYRVGAKQLRLLLAQRDAEIADLKRRAAWLEQQARDARRMLAAVENGRVMRILRWLTRSN